MAAVLVVSDLWPPFPGGAERLMFNLGRDLMRRGHTVHVVTGYGPALQYDGPPVTALDIGVRDDHAQGAGQLADVIALAEPDVLLVHHFYAHEFHAELVATGIPIVHVVLNGERMPEAALAVFISEWIAARCGWVHGDLVITPPAMSDVVADTHGDAIGMVKPLPHKGIDLLYQIAAALPERQFVVLRGEWQTLEDIRPMPNIEFMEPVVHMADFYARCRLVLMPSRSEDAGTVAQEATLNGLVCISSNVGGLAETNRGGLQLDPDDLGGWVAAIRGMDAPDLYDSAVQAQCLNLMAADHPAKLAHLSDRIGAMA